METVPIRPRYYETEPLIAGGITSKPAAQAPPQVQAQVQAQVQPQVQAPPADRPGTTKGLFTSMYDNKIIVLIVVIIIVIIAIFAYVIYRKDDTEPPKPRQRKNPQIVDNIAGGNDKVVDNPIKPANHTEVAADPVDNAAKQDQLKKLLERGRAAVATPTEEPVEEPEFDDEKAEQEILDLMMVDDSEESPRITAVDGSTLNDRTLEGAITDNSITLGTITVGTNMQDETNVQADTDDTPLIAATTITPDPTRCSSIVKNKQCKNRRGVNGKCGVHSR